MIQKESLNLHLLPFHRLRHVATCPNSAEGIVCEHLSVQVPDRVLRNRWFVRPNLIRSLNGAQERVDKTSLWAAFTPVGLRRVATCPNSAEGIVCEPLSVQVPDRVLRNRWFVRPNLIRSLNGAQERVDKTSLWAAFTPVGLRRVATCPNSAEGIVCEPLSVQVPDRVLRNRWFVRPNLIRSLNGAQERT